jgi:uncharacterized membrane protein
MKKLILSWILRLVPAIILLQTLFFKFTVSEESVYIFTKLNAEPYGRIGSGIVELAAAILLLYPRTTFWGAVIGFGTMAGAVVSHLLVLGIEVKDDGGTLFALALITLLCCLALIIQERDKLFRFTKLNF